MSNWRTLSRSLGAVRGPHGHGPKPFLNKPGQAQGTHGGKAKGGRIGLPSKRKDFKTHGRDVPTLAAKGGRIGLQYGGPPNRGRTNLLEQLGRVEAERSNPNRRAEISRVHGELNRGYNKGGRVGLKNGGKPWGTGPKPGTHEFLEHVIHKPRKKKAIGGVARGARKAADTFTEKVGGSAEGKPHSTRAGRISAGVRKIKRGVKEGIKGAKEGIKKVATPFVKESIWLDKLRNRKMGPRGKDKSPRRPEAGPQAPSRSPIPKNPWAKPSQLQKSDKERRDELRKHARKSGAHSKIIFADEWKHIDPGLKKGLFKKDGGRAGLKKGGKSDKNWIQKAVNPKHKGFCTPMTKKTCTPRRKALARTFKKMGRERKAKG